MRNVIEKVMASEKEAADILSKAKDDAAKLVADGRVAAQNEAASIKLAAHEEADKIVSDAVQTASADANQELSSAKSKIDHSICLSDADRESLSDAVVRCVTGAGKAGK